MPNWTPGPWTVETPLGPDILSIVPAGKPTYEWVIIADCAFDESEDDGGITRKQQAANATLIAAAPDLLAALKEITVTSGVGVHGRMRAIARAAIAKAEGREP